VLFERGALAHIITGWALPNTANCLTVQSARLLFSDAMLELWQDRYGYHEVTAERIDDRNVLFRNFEEGGLVSGFGMDCPGKVIRNIRRHRSGDMSPAEREELLSPMSLGFYTTLVCECAHASLAAAGSDEGGVVLGSTVEVRRFLEERIGADARGYLP
jgi:hypothetical protein